MATAIVCCADPVPPATALTDLYKQSLQELRKGEVRNALASAQSGYDDAVRQKNQKYQVASLLMLGNGYSSSMQYRRALSVLAQAAQLSRSLPGMEEYTAGASSVMSSIFARQGHQDLAFREADRAFHALLPTASPSLKSQVLLAMANSKYALGQRQEASRLYEEAIDSAARDSDQTALADACNDLGFTLLMEHKLSAAEAALTEAYRLRLLNRKAGLDTSYRNLGYLRILQGDSRSAIVLLDRAIELRLAGRSRVPAWSLYFQRSRAKRAAGDLEGALSDLQRSIDDARLWRAHILPIDEVQVSGDVYLATVYSEFIRTAMQLSKSRRDPSLVERAFLAAEENRAGAIQQSRAWRQSLPPQYWEVLAESRRAEIAALGRPSDATLARNLRQLRTDLASIEASLGFSSPEISERNTSKQALSVFRQCLHPGEALISFHLGEEESFAWALTSTALQVSQLPPRSVFADLVTRFRSSVISGKSEEQVSRALYNTLFGGLTPTLERYPEWVLTLDDVLFEMPLAALRTSTGFVAESHSLRIVPSAHLLDGGRAASPPRGFVGIGDPIYNTADPRWRKLQPPGTVPDRAEVIPAELLQLPRLPAGGAEIAAAAGAWKSPTKLLTGAAVNRTRITQELRMQRSVFHFAIHVLQARDAPEQSYMALGLDPSGRPDFFTIAEIAALKCDGQLIVLSACSSGQGKALPGAGQLGLTRAWLLGGARAVTASLWPTPDEEGSIFLAYYRELARRPGPLSARSSARALRQAQAEMIGSRSWRSEPRYWAAFFVVGRD